VHCQLAMTLLSDLLLGFAGRTWLTAVLPSFFVAYWLLWIVYAKTLHPLAKVPGPFWPGVSRTWLMYRAYAGDLEIRQRELHAQYGPLLRVAPGTYTPSVAKMQPKLTIQMTKLSAMIQGKSLLSIL
jgi:hypothetical protein